MKSVERLSPPESNPGIVYIDNSLEFMKTCEDMPWKHDKPTPTPIRNEWNRRKNCQRSKRKTSTLVYPLMSSKDKNKLHQFSSKVLQSILIGYALNAGGGWQKVGGQFIFPCASGPKKGGGPSRHTSNRVDQLRVSTKIPMDVFPQTKMMQKSKKTL